MAVIKSRYAEAYISPMTDFGITVGFNLEKHTGLDFAWVTNPYAPIYPIQNGKVVDVFSSDSCGYSVVVQHDYSDGTKRYSAYLHLKKAASVKVGQEVFALNSDNPTILGYRGNTGRSTGPHLHLYVTDRTTKSYNWNLISHGSSTHICKHDPWPQMYKTNKIKTWNGEKAKSLPVFEDTKFMAYPEAVKRNEYVAQIEIKGATQLLMRKSPERSNNAYDEYAPNGIFNLLDKKVADGYTWIKIASIDGNDFWVAKLSYVTELPVIIIPKPVERNENVKQCEVLHNKVILRKSAGGDDYDPYAPVGIHNVLAEKEANGYVWYMIGKDEDEHEFWVASGGARTKDLPIVQEQPKDEEKPVEPTPDPVEPEQPEPKPVEPDPAPSYDPSELNTLIAMIDELKERISNLAIEDATHATKIAELEADNKAKETIIKGLEESEKNLSDKVDGLNNKLADGVKELKEAIEVLGK